jgi:hypothetical protein
MQNNLNFNENYIDKAKNKLQITFCEWNLVFCYKKDIISLLINVNHEYYVTINNMLLPAITIGECTVLLYELTKKSTPPLQQVIDECIAIHHKLLLFSNYNPYVETDLTEDTLSRLKIFFMTNL